MNLDFESLLGETTTLSKETFMKLSEKIPEFLGRFKARKQGFLELAENPSELSACQELAKKLSGHFQDIVILGIGGSALGITCLRDALKGPYWNNYGTPRCFILDNLDLISELERCIDLKKTLFVVISKSGSTPETLAQYFYFKEKVSKEQFVFITDPKEGELRQIGKKKGIPLLSIPENVGGRFSVLSSVGLFPAFLLNIQVTDLLRGAKNLAQQFHSSHWEQNLPFQLATLLYLLDTQENLRQLVIMPYSSPLWSFADWCRQLIAESLGKDGKGITPIRGLGATDQHSQVQLYNEGPRDKAILFIDVLKNPESEQKIPEIGSEKLSYLSGLTFHQLLRTEKEATEKALSQYKKPHLTLKIPYLDAYHLGALFMLFEGAIAFLGEYYEINAFDQPGVELAKQMTKERLTTST